MLERFAYSGIASNLISYFTGPLHQSTVVAAANVNAWSGATYLLPLLGAFVADSYLGHYQTIIFASLLYVLGLGLLTLSVMLPPHDSSTCGSSNETAFCTSPTWFQLFIFFSSLYLISLALGGHKPCLQAFGAGQFDQQDPKESKSKSSFFNWWYFGICASTVVSQWILNYIQDNIGWDLGFGIPCISMAFGLVLFLLGRKTYRSSPKIDDRPFERIVHVFVGATNQEAASTTAVKRYLPRVEVDRGERPLLGGTQFMILDEAPAAADGLERMPSASVLEEAKGLLRLVPIWAACLIYAVVVSQSSTLFTRQGRTMERYIGPNFQIPAAALQTFISLSIVIVIPIYDCILVPTARSFTGSAFGIPLVQRIGIGMCLSVLSMVVAALVEAKRLAIARDAGLVDIPTAIIPMSVGWLVPQYVLFGISDVFTIVGLQEFFYSQVPEKLRSVGLALYLSIFGTGSFLSGFFITTIDIVTRRAGGESWFSDNLNRARLDYFYWLLAGLSVIELAVYLYVSRLLTPRTVTRM